MKKTSPKKTTSKTPIIGQQLGEHHAIYHCDCIEGMKNIPDNSVGYSIYSPPFEGLYCYSASDRDMGNCKSSEEFFAQLQFLIKEQFRTLQEGRLVSFHCINLPTSKTHHGYIGIRDFRGDLIRAYQAAGFIYHSEVCIWKDPLTAMQRTKAIGLLHNQLVKDSAISRQGLPDYLVTMRKPGVNKKPITHGAGFDEFIGENPPDGKRTKSAWDNKYGHQAWRKYASPVWMDINPSDTLQFRSARENNDERHICPLQLQVIERGLVLWSNPGDTVLSPFMGIGSEGYVSIEHGRNFIGFELKESYFKQSCANLQIAEQKFKETMLL